MAKAVQDYDEMVRRMSQTAEIAGAGEIDLDRDPWQPRWRIETRWIEFECGCTAERARELVDPRPSDPIIFRGLPQQAVYSEVCDRHRPGMNKYVGFGAPGLTFEQWKRSRRALLMRKA